MSGKILLSILLKTVQCPIALVHFLLNELYHFFGIEVNFAPILADKLNEKVTHQLEYYLSELIDLFAFSFRLLLYKVEYFIHFIRILQRIVWLLKGFLKRNCILKTIGSKIVGSL
jgi:hypothetical protein